MGLNIAKAAYFDTQVSEHWAASDYTPEEMRKIERMLDLAQIEYGNKVVEPGCGTGRLTQILSKCVGPDGNVLSMDISPRMTSDCSRRTSCLQNVQVVCSPVESYGFEERGYDRVICHNVFPHFDDKPRAVQTLARTLKSSGKFIVFHFMNSDWINDLHRKAHSSVLNDLLPNSDDMARIFALANLKITHLTDDEMGYLLSAIFTN
jgi:ubiquinone/menaquinone biosynthesis C-methylase UbiE